MQILLVPFVLLNALFYGLASLVAIPLGKLMICVGFGFTDAQMVARQVRFYATILCWMVLLAWAFGAGPFKRSYSQGDSQSRNAVSQRANKVECAGDVQHLAKQNNTSLPPSTEAAKLRVTQNLATNIYISEASWKVLSHITTGRPYVSFDRYLRIRRAAEKGHVMAQLQLGLFYYNGECVDKDMTEAIKWFRKAAEQGNAMAQCLMGELYCAGNGIAKDMSKGMKWLHKSAEQGHAKAQCVLGCFYYDGKDVPEDKNEAVKWFRKAAEQGDSTAQVMLGICYYKGDGATKDVTEAKKWLCKAAEQGNENAKEVLRKLNSENSVGK